jgi:hypothetical protein
VAQKAIKKYAFSNNKNSEAMINTAPREVELEGKYTEHQKDILSSIVYFNIFQFPLKQAEIQNLLKNNTSETLTSKALQKLVLSEVIFKYNGYYSCHREVQLLVSKRLKNESTTGHFFDKLPLYVRIISGFPFIRGVAISGSLSKGVLHKKGDIDYFIITKEGRLWLARTLLILFKKILLFNSNKYFCVNFFITENNLKIEDENRFTATEIAYLIPVYNAELIQVFKESNGWLRQYYGHFKHPIQLKDEKNEGEIVKNAFESLLNNKLGESLDKIFMKMTLRKWNKKFKQFSSLKFELTMRSRNNISKHHPQDFQTKVLDQFEKDYHSIISQ